MTYTPTNKQKYFRLTPEEFEQLERLARIWGGPVKPLAQVDVIRECLRRAWEAEQRKVKKAD